jgi:copper(I)-binding protein
MFRLVTVQRLPVRLACCSPWRGTSIGRGRRFCRSPASRPGIPTRRRLDLGRGAGTFRHHLTIPLPPALQSKSIQADFPMSLFRSRLFAVLVAATTGSFMLFPSALAAPPSGFVLAAGDGIMVPEAWARASAGAATTGAAYVALMGGAQPDQLVGVSTPVATTAEVHETIDDNGVMKMRSVTAIPIPPGQMVTFTPGGTHIMLTGLKQKLVAGQNFPLTLTFAHAAPVTVDVQVRALGGSRGDPMHMQ